MKDALALLVSYNRSANEDVYALLADADPELLTRDSGSYYGSILGLLNHLLLADLGWLSALRESPTEFPVLHDPALDYEQPGRKKNLYDDFPALRSHREKVDALMAAFVEETDAALWGQTVPLMRRGTQTDIPLGPVLMHLVNHATHHRGAIAQILDEQGVKNDYSNLIWRVIER